MIRYQVHGFERLSYAAVGDSKRWLIIESFVLCILIESPFKAIFVVIGVFKFQSYFATGISAYHRLCSSVFM